MAEIIPLPMDAEALWLIYQRAFERWEVERTAEAFMAKERAFIEFQEAFCGRGAA